MNFRSETIRDGTEGPCTVCGALAGEDTSGWTCGYGMTGATLCPEHTNDFRSRPQLFFAALIADGLDRRVSQVRGLAACVPDIKKDEYIQGKIYGLLIVVKAFCKDFDVDIVSDEDREEIIENAAERVAIQAGIGRCDGCDEIERLDRIENLLPTAPTENGHFVVRLPDIGGLNIRCICDRIAP